MHPCGNLNKVCVFLQCMDACCMWQRVEEEDVDRDQRLTRWQLSLIHLQASASTHTCSGTHARPRTTGVTARSGKFTLIRLLVFPSLRQEICEAFITLLIYLFINLVSQSVSHVFFMAEKLSVISLSYQMVEGLINNFKSNNWRAGQIHTNTLVMALYIHTHNIRLLHKVLHECISSTFLMYSCCTKIKQKSSPLYSRHIYVQCLSPRYGGCSPSSPDCLWKR